MMPFATNVGSIPLVLGQVHPCNLRNPNAKQSRGGYVLKMETLDVLKIDALRIHRRESQGGRQAGSRPLVRCSTIMVGSRAQSVVIGAQRCVREFGKRIDSA
jgi:hypothetical protein